ncbi:alpha-amylase family glycosyl hydrolase [Rubrivirga sp. IMCC45206]|uniref:alpha-amylase family glycosyl hydrolase n=1 Tax=Rubrivirga sp. IMCC45206 TaxID=3391614 RepID=UPI0039902218
MLRLLALALLAAPALAQTADADRRRGYTRDGDRVVFVFDSARYGVTPEAVAVTGPFRGWSTDDADPAWALAPAGDGLWTLAVDPGAAGLGPATPFKFRADGRWLDPPAEAPNVAGGNLVYRFGEVPARLVAELRGEGAVWVEVTGTDRPLIASDYRVARWDGEPIAVAGLTPHEAHSALLATGPLDPAHVHWVEVDTPAGTLRARARFDGLWRDLTSPKPMGVQARLRETTFRLFAPRADSVHLALYADRTGLASGHRSLVRDADGVWEHVEPDGLEGVWYDFAVYGPDGPGSAFTNQTGARVTDPYALVSDDSWGRARVWRDRIARTGTRARPRPALEDVVAYEVHLQDFTDALPVPDGVGPLEAFAMPDLRNARGEPVGLDHIANLGVNTVHLMPVQEFLHYPDAEWQAAFADDAFMREQGIGRENYQWGYRTTHAFAIESRFRSAGDEPGRERERLAALVDTLHARGLAVVVDVVFNHTGENMEGDERLFTFNGIDKWYHYRLDDEGRHIGAFGNEVKSENRPFVQRWLLDQLRQLVDVFGIDGFRIDLAGQTDEQTLRWLQAELGDDVLIYGEPWIASNDPDYEANPSWDWYKADSPITFFQDDARNAFKGTPLDDPTPAPISRGFAGGDPGARDAALRGVGNDYPEEATPTGGINYLDIHDNWALADRFASCQTGECRWDGRLGVREAEMRIAATLLLTSLGPVVLHGGTEFARSKGLAPLADDWGGELRLDAMTLAPIYLKGRGDTYNLRAANTFRWDEVGATAPVDRAAMLAWWRGLLALRASDAGDVFRIGGPVPPGWVREVPGGGPQALGYLVGDRVLVLINAGDAPAQFAPDLPGVDWRLVADADADGGVVDVSRFGRGVLAAQAAAAPVPAKGVRIWVRAD